MSGFDPILLDLDGTVIDSVALIRESHRHAVTTVLGEDWPDERLVANVGHPLLEQYEGIAEILTELKSAGRRLGIVTSKSRDAVALAWGVLPDLEEIFDVVIAAEDTPIHKPDPAPVREALARLGAGPEGACYVGDAPFDLQAGRAAGVTTIAVTWGFFSTADLVAERPDIVVDTPQELLRTCLRGV